MTRPLPPLVLLLLSSACADGGASAGGGADVPPTDREVAALDAARAAEPVPDEWRFAPGLPEAYKALPPGTHRRHDPLALLVNLEDERWSFRWPEHTGQRIVKATNNLGFLDDEVTRLEAPGPRVLVLGDSHTDGVVENAESFANVLEAGLRATSGWEGAEVLNAGVGFTGPRAYLGQLRRNLYLRPRVVVAAVFAGNDFWNDLFVEYLEHDEEPPPPGPEYKERLRAATDLWEVACWQGANQLARFRRFPQERERSRRAVLRSLGDMQALCDERGMHLVVVVLPTKFDVDEDLDPARVAALAGALELDAVALHDNLRLADDVRAELVASGVHCVDATPALDAADEPTYWSKDHHLNVAGHRIVGELLQRELVVRLERP